MQRIVSQQSSHVSKSVLTWTTEDIDDILVHGDELYTCMKQQNMISDACGSGYILVNELPTELVLNNRKVSLEYLAPCTGVIGLEEYAPDVQDLAMPLDEALQRAIN